MAVDPLVDLLWRYGHFRNPLHPELAEIKESDLDGLSLTDAVVKKAIASYQEFFSEQLNAATLDTYGRMASIDGEIGPCTAALLMADRCQCPDFEQALVDHNLMEATGSGSWPHSCYPEYPNIHVVKISVNPNRMPSFLKPVWEEVKKNTYQAYAEIGLKIIWLGANEDAHIKMTFESLRGSTIGLAIVGRGQKCSTRMWAKFDPGYHPRNIVREWTTLVMHELGHNMGLGHSRGGVMNPSVISGLRLTWIGDPSFGQLKRWFGGEEIPDTPDAPDDPVGPRMWVEKGFKDNRGKEIWFEMYPPVPAEEIGTLG